jgi:transcriptional regulator with XRE-family HTH domain
MSWWKDTPEERRAFAEEGLIAEATELVAEALVERGWSRRTLAEALKVRPSEITQRLRGKRNLTLRSLAAMLDAMDFDVILRKRDRQQPRAVGATTWAGPTGKIKPVGDIPSVFRGASNAWITYGSLGGSSEASPAAQRISQLSGAQ